MKLLIVRIYVVWTVVLLTAPAAVVAWVLAVSGVSAVLPSWGWVLIAPALYAAWLLVFLYMNMGLMALAGRRYPKPENLRPDSPRAAARGIAVAMSYIRLHTLQTLPLGLTFLRFGPLRNLCMRSYSPAQHVHDSAQVFGTIYDPDITWIGQHSIVGHDAVLVGHVVNALPDGSLRYQSAPIRIGQGVTIGGRAYVGMGANIADGALVQQASYVQPYTIIGAGEVWGGNPAQHLDSHVPSCTSDAVPASSASAAIDREAIRRLVVDVLQIPAEQADKEIGAESCRAWDSLGRCIIGAELYGKYGIKLTPSQIMQLNTIDDVVSVIGKLSAIASSGSIDAVPPMEDPEWLPLLDLEDARRALERFAWHPAKPAVTQNLVVAANFSAFPLDEGLRRWSRAFGIAAHVEFAGYDQIIPSLLAPDGAFAKHSDKLSVVLVCIEHLHLSGDAEAAEVVAPVLDAIEQFSVRHPGRRLVVGTLPPVVLATVPASHSTAELVRFEWRRRLERMTHVDLIDIAGAIERLGIDRAGSSAFEATTRTPYSLEGCDAMSAVLARAVRARHVSPAKVIALDCDGVLWGGVVGEDGRNGIELGPDGPGRAYVMFQHELLRLQKSGVLLALVSRNEAGDVWDVFERHPNMVLKRNDIAASRINWRSKSANIREIAMELNLGLDAFVFIDDDPANRSEVKAGVPLVHVVPMPQEAAAYVQTLGRLWLFDQGAVTAVDRDRTAMMQQEQRRRSAKDAALNYESYLAGLGLKVAVRRPNDNEWPRVAQLAQRTNQFNLSLKRRTLDEFRSLESPVEVLVLDAGDRYGEYGLTGLMVLGADEADDRAVLIDTFLLSCRVLGRGVEQALLHVAAEWARSLGKLRLRAPFEIGPRNAPVREFFRDAGLDEDDHCFEGSISNVAEKPPHVQLRFDRPIAVEIRPAAT